MLGEHIWNITTLITYHTTESIWTVNISLTQNWELEMLRFTCMMQFIVIKRQLRQTNTGKDKSVQEKWPVTSSNMLNK